MTRAFRLAGLVLAALLATPALASEPASRPHIRRGHEAFNVGDLVGARWSFQAALQAAPLPGTEPWAEARYWLGRTALRQGQAGEAVGHLKAALGAGVTRQEDYENAPYWLGEAYLAARQPADAFSLWQRAAESPNQALRQMDLPAYVRLASRAIQAQQRPKDAHAHMELGRAYHRLGRVGEAVARYTRALSLAPQLVDGWVLLGVAKEAAGDLGGARRAWREGSKHAPHDARFPRLQRLLARPLAAAPKADAGLLVVCYHRVANSPESTTVTPAQFAAHLDALREEGRTPVTLQAAEAYLAGKATAVAKPVLLTFDDGYLDFFTTAWPELQRRNMPAVAFLIAKEIGRGDHMDFEQIRALARTGKVAFGSHTTSHPFLTTLSYDEAFAELAASRLTLAGAIGQPVDSVAYPYGNMNDGVVAAAAAGGSKLGFTLIAGEVRPGAAPLRLKRIEAMRGDSPLRFRLKLAGDTAWLERLISAGA